MRVLWILAVAAVIGTVAGQADDDYWYSDLQLEPDYEWYPDLNTGTLSNGDRESADDSSSSELVQNDEDEKQVEDDITKYLNDLENIKDYQFEDNRSEAKEEVPENDRKENLSADNDDSSQADDHEEKEVKANDSKQAAVSEDTSVYKANQNIFDETEALLDESNDDDDTAKLAEEEIKKALGWSDSSDTDEEETGVTKGLLEELNKIVMAMEKDDDEDKKDSKAENDTDVFKFEDDSNSAEVKSVWRNMEILQGTNKLLETEKETKTEDENVENILEETKNILSDVNKDEDTSEFANDNNTDIEPIRASAAIMLETNQLLEEEEKSSENIVDEIPNESEMTETKDSDNKKNEQEYTDDMNLSKKSNEEEPDNAKNVIINEESSSKENKISDESDEDTVDKIYADLNEDLNQLFETWGNLVNDVEEKSTEDKNGTVQQYEEKYGKPYGEDTVLSQRNNYEDAASNEVIPDNNVQEFDDDYYDNEDTNIEVPETIKTTLSEINDVKPVSNPVVDTPEKSKIETLNVDQLNPSQYDDLMRQFRDSHKDALNIETNNIGTHIAPIRMVISVDEVKEVTSPNYPSPYPTNNVIDWIFDGEGTGIELNITDFAINGLFEDYLLVIPGGVDNSRTDGLLFSYQLNEERTYRFFDVDRLFVRFVSNPGMAFFRGFKFSVRLIAHIPEEEEIPEPEVVLPEVPATLTLMLGGVTVREFREIQEDFRSLISLMATMYINANSIDPGLNTTLEVTQITSITLCNVDWPDFENCTQVRIGVPVVEELGVLATRLTEKELIDMWNTYVDTDPFALRLRRMGIEEFAIPNDGRMMLIWLVIAIGVLISMTMLAFALWKFSCFEDYTRMAAYSDTDSVNNEKRGLDLYPTPHQTLPPLFNENEYKWDDGKFEDANRVDLGGYSNTSYVQDIYDIDSDEDVVVTNRDRSAVSSRDIYQV